MYVNPARLGIPRLQPGEECAVTRGRSRYYREPPAPAGGGSTADERSLKFKKGFIMDIFLQGVKKYD